MDILLYTPVGFINGVTPFGAAFVIFCATTLPLLTALWAVIYLLFRPIPDHCAFAPLENIPRRIYTLFLLCLSSFGAYLAVSVLKNYFQIGRPVLLNFNLHPLISLTDFGFPSSHAAVFAAIATALFLIHRRAGVYAGLLALIIGAARILAGVHTPLDILGGYLVGVCVGGLVVFLAQKISKKPQNSIAKESINS